LVIVVVVVVQQSLYKRKAVTIILLTFLFFCQIFRFLLISNLPPSIGSFSFQLIYLIIFYKSDVGTQGVERNYNEFFS
jgi:hypothetical protein